MTCALIDGEHLEQALGQGAVKLLDATKFLPEHGRDAAAEYAAGHISGARFMDLAHLTDGESAIENMAPPAAVFAAQMRALGLDRTDWIVLYDDSPLRSAARAWWLLQLFGAQDVAILDGGLARWKAEGRPVTTNMPQGSEGGFEAVAHRGLVRDLDAVRLAVNSGEATILDARSRARFEGSEPESRPGLASGHIPGSHNLPFGTLFRPDGTWKRGEALRAAFAEAGVDPARPLITTCGSGMTAAVLAFGACLLGMEEVSVYDGSWAEWGARADLPKDMGAR